MVGALLAAAILLRVACIFRYRIDSDEPQHLHLVWAWTHGLLPYRDVFDNHMPLFHMLCAPLLIAIGERPAALVIMRLAMLPLYGVVLWSIGRIARVIFSPRDALWAVVLGGLAAGYFLCSLEFRPDDLWAACWFLALVVAVEGTVTPRRSALIGLLLGAAAGVSIKTVLMLAAIAGGSVGAIAMVATHGRTARVPRIGANALAAVAGFVLIPLVVTLGFTLAGALDAYLYGIVWHNLLPGLGRRTTAPLDWLLLSLALAAVAWLSSVLFRCTREPGVASRRVFVCLVTALYLAALFTIAPVRSRQDYLPFYPLLMLWLVPPLRGLGDLVADWWPRVPRFAVLALATLVAMGVLVVRGTPWRDGLQPATDLVADVLRLTDPGEPLLDMKGEAVFRPRPFHYALEGVTKTRLGRGLIADSIPEDLVRTRTLVALADVRGFPPRGRAFLREHYVPIGVLRVAGQLLTAGPEPEPALTFEVVVPATYAIVAERGRVSGRLDGTRYAGPRPLAPGRHVFTALETPGRLAVVWARAVERGFSPFAEGPITAN